MRPGDTSAARQKTGAQIIVVFFGMTASGKSTLARAWAERCNAPYYNTDRVRKEIAGLSPATRRPDGIGQGIYTSELTAQTYRTILDRACEDLANGEALVVLDGSYGKRADRDQVRRAAARVGARCLFFLCTCAENEVRRRLDQRGRDPEAVSDGRWEIYLHQRHTFEVPEMSEERDCSLLKTEQPVEAMLAWLAQNPLLSK